MRALIAVILLSIVGANVWAQAQQNGVSDADLPTLSSVQRLLDEGNTRQALAALEQRIEANVNDIQARFLKGLVLIEQGDNAAARDVYLEIARLFPKIPEAFNNLAAIYVAEGEFEKARQALISAQANAPEYPLVRVNLGDLYVKMAAQAYREALTLDASDDTSAAKLSVLQQLLGDDG